MSALPLAATSGYLAAAYVVFVVLLLIYGTIMAIRLSRAERDISEIATRIEEQASEAKAAERLEEHSAR